MSAVLLSIIHTELGNSGRNGVDDKLREPALRCLDCRLTWMHYCRVAAGLCTDDSIIAGDLRVVASQRRAMYEPNVTFESVLVMLQETSLLGCVTEKPE